jgi:hypothetical protein
MNGKKGTLRAGATIVAAVIAIFIFSIANSMDGVFDRSAEIEKYLEAVKSGTRGANIDAAREIFNSGIGDERLAAALSERLLADFKRIDTLERNNEEYVRWLVKALASMGIKAYEPSLARVCKESSNNQIKTSCAEERAKIDWYRSRNEIMSSRKYFSEGDDPKVARMLNLIEADDFSYKQYASDRMNWSRMLDPKLMDAVDRQVLLHVEATRHGVSRDQAKAMGMFIKLLGYSGNVKYRATLEKVKASKATSLMKKYADESLKRLQV